MVLTSLALSLDVQVKATSASQAEEVIAVLRDPGSNTDLLKTEVKISNDCHRNVS